MINVAMISTFTILAVLSDFMWTVLNVHLSELALVISLIPLVIALFTIIASGTIIGAGLTVVYALSSLNGFVMGMIFASQ